MHQTGDSGRYNYMYRHDQQAEYMGKSAIWSSILNALMKVPSFRVDRDKFLKATFGRYGLPDDVRVMNPVSIYGEETVEREADKVVRQYTRKATLLSAAAGLPGGLALLGTIPADVVQFYRNYLVMAQKLAYLYGWSDLSADPGRMDEHGLEKLTVLAGAGFGIEGAAEALEMVVRETTGNLGRSLPKIAGRATRWYPIVRNIGAWLGIKITRDSAGKVAGKAVPLLGGALTGAISYIAFRTLARRLRTELSTTAYTKQYKGISLDKTDGQK